MRWWKLPREKDIEEQAAELIATLQGVAYGVSMTAVELKMSIEELKRVTSELKDQTGNIPLEGGR